jgi:lipopolysaccharide biosynthesis glycosyltransferase
MSNSTMNVNIVLAGDRGVVPGLAVTVRSALENATSMLNVHIMSKGLLEADKTQLQMSWNHPNCGQLTFVEIAKESVQRFRSTAYLKSKAAYARYFIAELFPNIGRCIYLDADLLVFRDLTEAFQMDLGDNLAAAVRDVSARISPHNPVLKRRLGLRDEGNYFNSGFMIIEPNAWRQEGLTDKLVELSIKRFDDMDSQDQDVLNIVLEDRVLLINEAWNTSQYEKPNPLAGRIVHLIGPVKPWHARYKAKFREPYYKNIIFYAFMDVLGRTEFREWHPWDFCGLGQYAELVVQKMPTRDMITGKLHRVARRIIRW